MHSCMVDSLNIPPINKYACSYTYLLELSVSTEDEGIDIGQKRSQTAVDAIIEVEESKLLHEEVFSEMKMHLEHTLKLSRPLTVLTCSKRGSNLITGSCGMVYYNLN